MLPIMTKGVLTCFNDKSVKQLGSNVVRFRPSGLANEVLNLLKLGGARGVVRDGDVVGLGLVKQISRESCSPCWLEYGSGFCRCPGPRAHLLRSVGSPEPRRASDVGQGREVCLDFFNRHNVCLRFCDRLDERVLPARFAVSTPGAVLPLSLDNVHTARCPLWALPHSRRYDLRVLALRQDPRAGVPCTCVTCYDAPACTTRGAGPAWGRVTATWADRGDNYSEPRGHRVPIRF